VRTCPECQTSYDDEVAHCPEDGFNLSGVESVDELVGRTIGSYTVTKLLGKGGMGSVYGGHHPVIGSRVAIKFLHPQYSTDEKIVERFFNEARAVNIIGHDNVLKILDLNVTEDNRHYFVMEYLHGRALQNIVRPNEPLGLDITGPILLQTCNALQAAHNKGIIHRDLKPDNIYLITLQGRKNFVKVVDFGIAKLTDSGGASTGKTQTGMVMGTPAYMSPEQGSGETSKIDGRSDVYSLGVMMYQMATGKLPFPGTNFGEVLMGHLQKQPPPPRSVVPEIPEDYEAVILKCLAKKQEDRYQSMAELHDAIFDVMQSHGISAELPFADETEELQALEFLGEPSNPGRPRGARSNPPKLPSNPRNPSSPRQATGSRQPSSPSQHPSRPGTRPGSRSGSTQPPQEKKSNLGMILGIVGAVVVLAAAGIGYSINASNKAEAAAARAREQERKRHEKELADAAAAAEAQQKEEKKDERVFLSIISDPPGANVDATWLEESKHAPAPFGFDVPRNTKVHFEYSKEGYAPFVTEVIADRAQQVKATLKPLPPAPPSGEDKAKPHGKKKPGADTTAQPDGLMDLGN